MPSYLGSKIRFFPVSGGSDSVASIGRTFDGASVQRGISRMVVSTSHSRLPTPKRINRAIWVKHDQAAGWRDLSCPLLGIGGWELTPCAVLSRCAELP